MRYKELKDPIARNLIAQRIRDKRSAIMTHGTYSKPHDGIKVCRQSLFDMVIGALCAGGFEEKEDHER